MNKTKTKNKGFTLIELLAVIIILGILMMIALPAMTKYIENSKRDAFWQTGKTYVNSARFGLLNEEFQSTKTSGTACSLPPTGKAVVVPTSIIELEKGSTKSAWNKELRHSYVVCVDEGTEAKPKYVYYYAGMDADSNGITAPIREDSLTRSTVLRGKANTLQYGTIGNNVSTALPKAISDICQAY